MYDSIASLPQPVLQLLDPTQQEIFRSSYNLAEIKTQDPQQALQSAWSECFSATGDANLGYLIDVSSMQFEDGKWFQAFPFGKWHHPLYGEINMTPEDAELIVKQFKEGVVGQDLDIDYDHKVHHGGAAGWIKDAAVRADGLYLAVEWTKRALDEIKDRVYRYFSPEYAKEWTHPVTQIKYKNVLRGGALTNRPFLKGIQPINLSEAIDVGIGSTTPQLSYYSGGNKMPLSAEQLAAARTNLGLSETASEEEVTTEALKRATAVAPPPPAPPTPPASIQATDREELVKLMEENPIVKGLVDQVNTLSATARLSEINFKLGEWSNPNSGHKWGLPTAIQDDLRNFMLSETPAQTSKLSELVEKILDKGLVKLGESGWKPGERNDGETFENPAQEVDRLAQKLTESDKTLSYGLAVERVLSENTQLAEAYYQSAAQ